MFNSLAELLANPLVWKVVVAYWIFSAAVGALDTPDASSGKAYKFAFRFLHALAGNVNRAALKFGVPGAKDADSNNP